MKCTIKAIGIGASLGGPTALVKILQGLSDTFSVPIFVVQHIIPGFTPDFIQWLQERTKLRICLAKNGEMAMPGWVYVAADACQMGVKKGGIISLVNIPIPVKQPSIDYLFKSLAETCQSHCIGVILTGMGNDGAEGLLAMKQQGALTIAQDEESCLVFGMPKEAILLGAVSQVLPLNRIAPMLNAQVAKSGGLHDRD